VKIVAPDRLRSFSQSQARLPKIAQSGSGPVRGVLLCMKAAPCDAPLSMPNHDIEGFRRGTTPPVDAEKLATATIALDIGLALQHYIDPGRVPLELYPDLFEALFGE
jgi:hypothetical protein